MSFSDGVKVTGESLSSAWVVLGIAYGSNSGCGNTQYSFVPTVPDPYSALASNIPSNPCSTYPQEPTKKNDPALPAGNQWSGTINLSGNGAGNGMVCGDLQLTGNVTINTPDNSTGATLVIENGQLDLNGYTLRTAQGSAVTIVFSGNNGGPYLHYPTDNSSGGGGSLNIQAASSASAPFPGIAIYQDPKLTTGVDVSYAGNSPTWNITGAVYMPNALSRDIRGLLRLFGRDFPP